jgi:flagellar protein FlbD
VLKLTRLNRGVIAVNPDHISWVDAAPDTTLRVLGGETLIVRESIDELIDKLIAYRKLIRGAPLPWEVDKTDVNLPPVELIHAHRRSTVPPSSRDGG